MHDVSYVSLIIPGCLAPENILMASTTKARTNGRNKTLSTRSVQWGPQTRTENSIPPFLSDWVHLLHIKHTWNPSEYSAKSSAEIIDYSAIVV